MIRKKDSLMLLLLAGILLHSGLFSQSLSEEDIDLYRDVVYAVADGYELKLDIAVPKYLKSPAPAIVDIPGGAWRVIKKSAEDAVFYAKYGFIGVSITHRTSDIAVFPAAVHDCKAAIRWLRANAGKYQLNPEKIGVTGFSSGGHLAALLGTSGGDAYLDGEGGSRGYSNRVQAVVDHFGPTDFLKMNDTEMEDRMDHFAEDSPESLFLGGPLKEKSGPASLANPIRYIDPKDPPVLIGHGEKDGMVIINQSELLYNALLAAGVPTKFVRVKDAGHMYRPYKWDAKISPSVTEMYELTIGWFQEWLGKPELDMDRIPVRTADPNISSEEEIPLYYKLTIDLPGNTETSYVRGRFKILCQGKVLAQGEFDMKDLSKEEDRVYLQKLVITGADLKGKEIMWNFQGEIFDSTLNETFEPMFMQGEIFNPSIEGIGYHIQIKEDGTFGIEKRVYRSDR